MALALKPFGLLYCMHNFTLLFSLLFLLASCAAPDVPPRHTLPHACQVYDLGQAACIDEASMVRRLTPYRVVFVGDHHASEAMHASFAGLLSALGESGRHVILANEWFTPEDDPLLARYAQETYEGNFTREINWSVKAGYPFASYEPIYDSVRRHGGELAGINMSKGMQKALSEHNLSSLSATQRLFYDRLDMNLTAHRDLLAPFFAHCHAPRDGETEAECTERMYRVQVAWDTYMAEQSAELFRTRLQNGDDLLVVFAGAMHLAYGTGINARFARRVEEPFVTILPVPEGTETADVGEADYLLFYRDGDAAKGPQ